VALAEAAMGGPYAAEGFGASLDLTGYAPEAEPEALLYGEDGARTVVTCSAAHLEALLALSGEHQVPVFRAGRVGAHSSGLELRVGARLFSWGIVTLRQTYFEAIPRRMQHPDVDRSVGA
jgi:hypothetical protein